MSNRRHARTATRPPLGGPAEGTAWLRGTAARRRRQVEALSLDLDGATTVVAPLGRSAFPGSREDRTCDRCDHFTPLGEMFYPVAYRPAPWLALVGGLCATCAGKELVR